MHKGSEVKKRIGLYAGSFDPPTNGHMSVIKQALRLVDELIVAVGTNPEKKCLFTVEERMAMLAEATGEMCGISVRNFENMYLVDYAYQCQANILIRGIRSPTDYQFERAMYDVNTAISDPSIITVYLFPPAELVGISSSLVKGLIGPKGWEAVVKRYVPSCVMCHLENKIAQKRLNQ